MPRYIDKDKLVNKLKEDYATLVKERWFDDYVQGYGSAIDDVVAEPTADVQEVKHGKWISEIVEIPDWRGKKQSYYQPNSCSICHTGLRVRTNFCPNCGAKMDGKET